MYKAMVFTIGALYGKSIQCISYVIAPRTLRLHIDQMIVDIDFSSILKVVGKEFQDDWASFAVTLQENCLISRYLATHAYATKTYRNPLANQTVEPTPYPNLPST